MGDGHDGYELHEVLGQGTSGVVHRATHRASGSVVALKLVRGADRRTLAAVEQEVQAMARVDHPNLLLLHDMGRLPEHEGLWLATEYASGGSLEGWLPRDWAELEEVLDALLPGLAHAHARGMVHRDLKPANVLHALPTDRTPGWKIGDFGLTMLRDVVPVHRRGGTPLYMAPEQWQRQRPTPAADLYSLGCMIWEWVVGSLPFYGDIDEVLRQHQQDQLPTFLPRFAVPRSVPALLAELLAKAPDDRPSSAGEVLRRVRTSPGVGAMELAGGRDTIPRALPGVGLPLLTLRDHAVVGRRELREQLAGALAAVVASNQPQITPGPLLVVACTKPASRWRKLEGQPGVHRVDVPPMRAQAFRWFLKGHVGLTSDAGERLHARCDGHPGLAMSWLGQLVAEGRMVASAEGFGLTDGPLPDPPPLHREQSELTRALCDRGDDAGRAALRVAASLGSHFLDEAWDGALGLLGLSVPQETVRALQLAGVLERDREGWRWTSQACREAAMGPHARPEEQVAVATSLLALPPDGLRQMGAGAAWLRAGRGADARSTVLSFDYPDDLGPVPMGVLQDTLARLRPVMNDASNEESVHYGRLQVQVELNARGGAHALPATRALLAKLGTSREPGPWWDGTSPESRLSALHAIAVILCFQGELDATERVLDGMQEDTVVLRCRSHMAHMGGDLNGAERLALDALDLHPTPRLRAVVLNDLGALFGERGDLVRSEQFFRRSAATMPTKHTYAQTLNIALSLLGQGRFEEAHQQVHAALLHAEATARWVEKIYSIATVIAALAGKVDEVALHGATARHLIERSPPDFAPRMWAHIRDGVGQGPVIDAFLEAVLARSPA